eukprot:TRINITY_DN6340_c0_g1_i1.p1 TRINITY_DN6340_c0_g1~~TRINITY_DN6340_c0_g1_i1.p1  ORF type:complete len:264 (+),score=16.65 TRINITY_DN6340_c0_g1_i1:32-793(+)
MPSRQEEWETDIESGLALWPKPAPVPDTTWGFWLKPVDKRSRHDETLGGDDASQSWRLQQVRATCTRDLQRGGTYALLLKNSTVLLFIMASVLHLAMISQTTDDLLQKSSLKQLLLGSFTWHSTAIRTVAVLWSAFVFFLREAWVAYGRVLTLQQTPLYLDPPTVEYFWQFGRFFCTIWDISNPIVVFAVFPYVFGTREQQKAGERMLELTWQQKQKEAMEKKQQEELEKERQQGATRRSSSSSPLIQRSRAR